MGYTPSNDDDILKRVDAFIGQSPTQPTGNSKAEALRRAADRLGVDAADLGAIISFESAGTFNPHKVGGEGNKYKGLIQFGPAEQKRYYKPNDTFETQVEDGVVRYFQDRFKQAGKDTRGATLEDLYTTVIAGNPKANRDAKDAFGTSARSGAQKILKEHRPKVLQNIFGGQSPSINDADFWDEIRQVVGQEDVTQADDLQFWGEIKNLVDEPSTVKPVTEKPETIDAQTPVPEKIETLDAQFAVAKDPANKARTSVFFPNDGTNRALQYADKLDAKQWGLFPDKKHNGLHLINLVKAKKLKLRTPKEIQDFIDKNPNALKTLGIVVEDVGNNTQGTAVVAKDADGKELAAGVVTNPASAVEQAKNYKDQFPNAQIEVTNTDDVVKARKDEVDLLAPTSPTGEADDPDEQGVLQARFAETRKADPSLTVEKFNQILKDEEEQKFLADNANYAEFLKQTGLPNTPESQKEYNLAQQASVAGANKQNRIDVEAYNKALPRQIQGQAQIQPQVPDNAPRVRVTDKIEINPNEVPEANADAYISYKVAERLAQQQGVDPSVIPDFIKAKGGTLLIGDPYTPEQVAEKKKANDNFRISFQPGLGDDLRIFASQLKDVKDAQQTEASLTQKMKDEALASVKNPDGTLNPFDPNAWTLAFEKLITDPSNTTVNEDDLKRVVEANVEESIKQAGSATEAQRLREEGNKLSNLDKASRFAGSIAKTILKSPASFAKTIAWAEDTVDYLKSKGAIIPTLTSADLLNGIDWAISKTFGLPEKEKTKAGTLPMMYAKAVEDLFKDDPVTAQLASTKFANAIGSAVPFLVGATLSGGSTAAVAALGIGMQVGEMYDEAQRDGLSREKQLLSGALGIPIGASEVAGLNFGRLGALLNKKSGGTFGKYFLKWLLETGKEATEETIQEFLQSTAGDLVKTGMLKNGLTRQDVAKALGQSTGDAVTGGIVGALFGGGVPIAASTAGALTAPNTKARTDALLKTEPEPVKTVIEPEAPVEAPKAKKTVEPKVEPKIEPKVVEETPVEVKKEAPRFKDGKREKVEKIDKQKYDTLDFEDEIPSQPAQVETKPLVQDQPTEVPVAGKTEVSGRYVDKDNKPQRFLHSTNTPEGTTLKPNSAKQFGKGIYFATDPTIVTGGDFGTRTVEAYLPSNLLDANSKEFNQIRADIEEATNTDYYEDNFPIEKLNAEIRKRGYKGIIHDHPEYGREAMVFKADDIEYVPKSTPNKTEIKTLDDIAKEVAQYPTVDKAFEAFKKRNDISADIAQAFADKYKTENDTPRQAFEKFYNDVTAKPANQSKALRELGYTLPMQKKLSEAEKQEIVDKGIRRQDAEKKKSQDAEFAKYEQNKSVIQSVSDKLFKHYTDQGYEVIRDSAQNGNTKYIELRKGDEYAKIRIADHGANTLTRNAPTVDIRIDGEEPSLDNVISQIDQKIWKPIQPLIAEGVKSAEKEPNTFPLGKYAVYKHGIAVKGGFASNDEATTWSQSQGDKRLSIKDSGTISIAPFKKGDRYSDSPTMEGVEAVRNPDLQQPSYKVGDTVTTPNGKVKGTVESVKGDTLGVAWENAPVEGDITETTADKVKPVGESTTKKSTKPEMLTQTIGGMTRRGYLIDDPKLGKRVQIVKDNGELGGTTKYVDSWKPVDQPMRQAITEDIYEQAKDDAGRIRGGSLEVRRLDSRGEQGRIKGGQRAVEASVLIGRDEAQRQEASQRGGSNVESISDTALTVESVDQPMAQVVDNEDNVLKRTPNKEDIKSFENAQSIPARQLIQDVDFNKNARVVEDGVVAVDEIREVELIRRLINEANGTRGGAFYGVFNSKKLTRKFLDTLTKKIKSANEKGIDTKQLKTLKMLVTNASKQDGTVIFAMDEEALTHEKVHRALNRYQTGTSKIAPDVQDAITNSPIFKKVSEGKWGRAYAHANPANKVEEFVTAASTLDWDALGIKSEADKRAAMSNVIDYYNSYAETNKGEGTAEEVLNALATEIAYVKEITNQDQKVQADEGTASEADGDSSIKDAERKEDRPDVKTEGKPDELAGKLKSREPGKSGLAFDEAEAEKAREAEMKVAAMSRAFGSEMYYVPVGMEETAATARQMIDDRGMQSIIQEALTGQPSAAGKLAVYWEMQRLSTQADMFKEDGREAEANVILNQLSDLVAALAVREQEMGREINISKWLPALSPEAAIMTAEKMVRKGFGDTSTISTDQTAKVKELAAELQKVRTQQTRSESIIAEQQRIIDNLDDEKPARVLNRQEALLENYKKKEKIIRAELAKRFPDSPVFNGEQSMLMAVGESTPKEVIIDPETASLLKDYTIGQVLTNRTYNEVIAEIQAISGASTEQAKDIHSLAMDEIRGAKEPTSEEAKKRIQIRQEHYQEADKHSHPEKQAKKAIQLAEANLKRQIDTLEKEIASGQKKVKTKNKVTSPEIERLKRERDALKSTRDELLGEGSTDEQKIARAIKSTRRSINRLTEKIQNNDTSVKTTEKLSNNELDNLKAERKTLQSILNDIRKEANKVQQSPKSQLTKIARQVAEKFPDDLELIIAADRLTGKELKSINDVINFLQTKYGFHITEAKELAQQAWREVQKIKESNKRAKDAALGIIEEERKKLDQIRVDKNNATRALNRFLSQLAANPNVIKRFNDDFRAKLVSNWGTQIFNAVQSTTVTTPAQILLDMFEAQLRSLGLNIGESSDVRARDAWRAYQYIFANNRKLAEQALAHFPEQYFEVHSGLLGDIPIDPLKLADTKKGLAKLAHRWFDANAKLNEKLTHITGAKLQEMHFRNAIVASTFDAIIRKRTDGKSNLEKAMADGTFKDIITEKDAQRAAARALEVTFASQINDPIGRELKKMYDKLDNYLPVLLNPVTYARFTYTTTKVMVLNPLTFGLTDQLLDLKNKPEDRTPYNTRDIAKGVLAWGTVVIAYGLMSALGGDDDKWYTLYPLGKDGPVWDIRRTFPLSAFFYTAHVIKESGVEGKPLPSKSEMLAGFASLETDYFQYGPVLELLGEVKDYAVTKGEKGEVKDAAIRTLGNYLAGMTRFFKPFRDTLAQFDAEERAYRDDPKTAQDKFINELSRSIPGIIRLSDQEKQYDIEGNPLEQKFPLGRIFGVNIANPALAKNKDSAATAWANELFPFVATKKMTPEERKMANARSAIREAVRAGKKVNVDDALENMKVTLSKKSLLRLKDELKYSELGAKVKYAFGDNPEKVKALKTIWKYATDQEKQEIQKVLREKKDVSRETKNLFQK